MAIPLVDVSWQHRQVRAEIDEAVNALLASPRCDLPEFVSALEAKVSRALGESVYAVGVQSGLAGEFLILKALGIGAGDEVITVPNSDISTTAAITHSGANFVLVDIDPRTFNLDPTQIERAITPRTRAIIPVHLYGLPAEMDAINEIARQHSLYVIEDATLALGATYRGAAVGTLGDAAFFSFDPGKVLGGLGNGGLVTTRDPQLAQRVRLLRGYGMDPAQGDLPVQQLQAATGLSYVAEGYNLKLDAIHAAVAGAKFSRRQEWGAQRQKAAAHYTARLSQIAGVEPPHVPAYMRHAWRNYVLKLQRRSEVRARLAQKEITSAVLYTPPVHLHPVYRHLGLSAGSFPNAEAVAQELLCLPMYPGLTVGHIDEVVDTIADTLAQNSQ
jgi:dTDP-4-amino-4,6-dideoxygalactose transaminase